jgi:hypothetical protein
LSIGAFDLIPNAACAQDANKIYRQTPEIAEVQGVQKPEASSQRDRLLKAGERPQWIWGDNPDTRYLIRKSFNASKVAEAWLTASADNGMSVSVNGKNIGRSDAWEEGMTVNVTSALVEGKNEIVFEAWNTGGVAALVAKLGWIDAQGQVQSVVTDGSWQVAPKDRPGEQGPQENRQLRR